MTHPKKLRSTDLERLARLDIFSWLIPPELKVLSASLAMSDYERGEVMFRESTQANEARVLVAGIARITCLNADNQRVTIALISPGLIPELPSLANCLGFRCEAHNECRVGTLDWKGFDRITVKGSHTALSKSHQNNLRHWYRLLRRASGLLNELHERIAFTMLDLCEDFGIDDSRGKLLSLQISHKEIASLVGASRPRVTEHLGRMERDHLLSRQGRQFIVDTRRISHSLAACPAERFPISRPGVSNDAAVTTSRLSIMATDSTSQQNAAEFSQKRGGTVADHRAHPPTAHNVT